MNVKPQRMWAIKWPDGEIFGAAPEKGIVRELAAKYYAPMTWPQMYRAGARCVRVEVREVEKKP